MQKFTKKLLKRSETYILVAVILLALAIQFQSGQFFRPNNMVDIASAMIVPGLFAIGAFLVLISGGVDVSFPALASLSMYATTKLMLDMNWQGGIWLPILVAIAIGAVLGAVNGALISFFNLNAMIVTLGTSSIFKGFMQGALNSKQLAVIPEGMQAFGKSALFVALDPESGLTSRMPTAILILLGVLMLCFFLVRYTIYGRGLYAIGGNEVSAHRAGFPVRKIKFLLYVLVGVIASLAGIIRTCMMTQCHPTNMLGMEMMVIAGVVLGGTAITGGAGSLTGAMLGTLLIVIVQNSMIMLGIPTFWQDFALGVLIVLGTGISAWQVARAAARTTGKNQQKEAAR